MNNKEKVLLHKGMDKVKRMEFLDALEIFERVLTMNPQIPDAWNNKGVALFRLGRPEEALECYARAQEIEPENLDALRNRAFVLRSLGRMEEALETYDTVLQKGGDAIDLESTAFVLTALGRLEEAINCLLLARDKAPLDRFETEIEQLKGMIEQKRSEADSVPGESSADEENSEGKE
ncbi:Photosystem I assembly protein Ycf3 [uncultured archaeon]|nr:Photosystem I assembly protein Ycf3 [uncultured archaeon]